MPIKVKAALCGVDMKKAFHSFSPHFNKKKTCIFLNINTMKIAVSLALKLQYRH